MAKFIVTSGSTFDPFTYDELVKPLEASQKAHDAAEEVYSNLDMETSAFARYITDNPDDRNAKALYDNYLEKLHTLQEDLWNNGVTNKTKRELATARSAYASDILRLQTAIKERQEAAKTWYDMRNANPDLVTSVNPGDAGLDKYLADDNFGKKIFSYNSAALEKDVFNEMRTRASELLRSLQDPNSIVKNPALQNILTRYLTKGMTNAEVNAAGVVSDAVRDMSEQQRDEFYRAHNIPVLAQMMAESLIDRYDATGIRQWEVEDSEAQRLWNRGKAGFVGAILGNDIKDFTDPTYELEAQKALLRYKKSLETPPSDGYTPSDVESGEFAGENYEKAKKHVDSIVGQKMPKYFTKFGDEISDVAQASELVYSGKLRREAYQKLGFDIGRDPGSTTIFNHDSNFLHGVIEHGDKKYEVRYNPKATANVNGKTVQGVVEIREEGSKDAWKPYKTKDEDYTAYYHEKRKQYEQRLKYYENNEKDLMQYATLNPDKQHKIYTEDEIDFNTPLTSYGDEYIAKPGNSQTASVYNVWVARGETDAGKIGERLGSWMGNNLRLKFDDKGKYTAENVKEWRTYDGKAGHIHEISLTGALDKKTITDVGDIFDFDSKGNIKNINGLQVTVDGLKNKYIIIRTTSGKRYAVGLDMFSSDFLDKTFENYYASIDDMVSVNPNITKEQASAYVVRNAANTIRQILGYSTSTVSKGGTSKEYE